MKKSRETISDIFVYKISINAENTVCTVIQILRKTSANLK